MSPRFFQSIDPSLQRDPENEKAALEPLLPSTPIEDQPRTRCLGLRRRRRCLRSSSENGNRGRKTCARLLHFIVVLTLFVVFLGPKIHNGLRTFWHRKMAHYPDREECVERAVWTPFDEPPVHPRYRYAASTSFELPRFSDLLYFLSGGSYANGVISIANSDSVSTDVVEVEIIASYNSRGLFDDVEVCTLHRDNDENKNGVGIFTPHYWPRPHNHEMHFFINVKLPYPDGGPEGQSLFFNDLESRLPLFTHHIGDLRDTAVFHSLDLSSTNAPTTVESLFAEQVNIKGTNSNIRGTFNVTERLELTTTNGAIRVNVNLDSDGKSETVALLHSTNGPIIGDFNLISSTLDNTKGVFRVVAHSSNSPVEAKVHTAPINHSLYLTAQTTNSPVTARLPTTYEGSFVINSSPYIPPTIQYDRDVPDPEGQGRRRRIEYHRQRRGDLEGNVAWSPSGSRTDLGTVGLTTTNSPAHLVL